MTKKKLIEELKTTTSLLRVAEADVENLSDAKWELVKELKSKGYEFKN